MALINRFGRLPQFTLTDIDIEAEAREAAQIVAERKVIRAGVECWQAIGRAESFESWKKNRRGFVDRKSSRAPRH
jgi:hypothetical protein